METQVGRKRVQGDPRGPGGPPHQSLLIRNIHTLVTMDAENRVLRGGYIYAENGEIRRVGSGTANLPKADRVIDGRHGPHIGSLEPGKRVDLAMFDLRGAVYSGAGDAVSALLLCAPAEVDTLVVEGRVVVEGGELQTVSLESTLRRHRRLAQKLQ